MRSAQRARREGKKREVGDRELAGDRARYVSL
jgi:hypothetical protein